MSIDAGAVNAQYRIDSSKPLDSNAFPGVEVDILIDTEEDRRRIPTSGRSVQPPGAGIGQRYLAHAQRRLGERSTRHHHSRARDRPRMSESR
jgi:hypothetical protein